MSRPSATPEPLNCRRASSSAAPAASTSSTRSARSAHRPYAVGYIRGPQAELAVHGGAVLALAAVTVLLRGAHARNDRRAGDHALRRIKATSRRREADSRSLRSAPCVLGDIDRPPGAKKPTLLKPCRPRLQLPVWRARPGRLLMLAQPSMAPRARGRRPRSWAWGDGRLLAGLYAVALRPCRRRKDLRVARAASSASSSVRRASRAWRRR